MLKRKLSLNALLAAVVGTVAYFAILLWWIDATRLAAFLETDQLNEFGDFLAGVFAPLAFLWLIAAVITQRQELNETRDQFKENQKVVDAQMKTIAAQNELLALQHTQAQESAKQTYKLNLFDKRFELYRDFLAFGEKHDKTNYMNDAYMEMLDLYQRSLFVFERDVSDWFGKIADEIHDHQQYREQETFLYRNEAGVNVLKFRSENAEKEIESTEAWLFDQFTLLDLRIEKFHPSMRVSDA